MVTKFFPAMFVCGLLMGASAIAQADYYPRPGDLRRQVSCDSNSYKYVSCPMDGEIIDAQVIRQVSKTRCAYGSTWGFQHNVLWVDNGCRAVFEVTIDGRTHGRTVDIDCASNSYKYATCAVPGRIADAYVLRQHSKSACVYGQSWGADHDYLWVDKGCRATFRLNLRRR